MTYKNKALCRVRTITTFIVLDENKSTWEPAILNATQCCEQLSAKFHQVGYVVQSIRIVTNAFGEYLNTKDINSAKSDLSFISSILNDNDHSGTRIRFAIGEAQTADEIALLPELIRDFGDLCNACVNVGRDEFGILDNELIAQSAEAVQHISRLTPRGEGNFNFTVNFNCEPLIPYFPASYHKSELGNQFVIGLETPDLLVEILQQFNNSNPEVSHNNRFQGSLESLKVGLQYHVDQIMNVVDGFQSDFTFSGIDSSAAPSKDCASMVDVYKQLGVEFFGAAGTVEASSLLTNVFKSIKGVPLVGFSGLMLAVTEDTGLAQGTIDGDYDIRTLLTNSAVCGIGLDTVPIPGSTTHDKITAIMRDTGTLAYRLNKPLTVRLFPVPGLNAGDITAFESDDLCNCAILAVP